MNKKILISALTLGISTMICSALPSVYSIKDTIVDNNIVYPESFDTDVKRASCQSGI